MKTYTDTELLDFLQKVTDRNSYTGKVVCRWSGIGRGWRLHETSRNDAKSNVRQAIIAFIESTY
jgi:hypothetical protein